MATAPATDALIIAKLPALFPSVRTHECARIYVVQEDLRS